MLCLLVEGDPADRRLGTDRRAGGAIPVVGHARGAADPGERAAPGSYTPGVSKGRLEAFSDGVMAILITIMVLDLHVPADPKLSALRPLVPVFLSYVLSFVNLGIYWNNHHHLLQSTERINGAILWANLNLLFWLSLFPFATGWMGENHFATVPTAMYGLVLLLAGTAYYILEMAIVSEHGPDSELAQALGSDRKGRLSMLIYAVAIPLAFVSRWIALTLYVVVALMWFIPDRRLAHPLVSPSTDD
jgi:uncharacterized membrane protein